MGMEEVKKGGFPGLIILYTQSFAKQDNYFSMQKISHWGEKKTQKTGFWKKQNCRAIYILYIFPPGFHFYQSLLLLCL